ncbi:MAG TPA: DNA alkylation repair protein [Aldersonia sp.]
MAALAEVADPADAVHLQRFFKTGPGEYGEGDVFVGVRVPQTRAVVKRHSDLPLPEVEALLDSDVHEHRLAGLLILDTQFERAGKPRTADPTLRVRIVDAYLAALRRGRVNNWDLVDASAPYLLGEWLLERSARNEHSGLLDDLAAGATLWERRVALLATFAFIKAGDPAPTLTLAQRLLDDRADLIQKALGWMLREVGKRVDVDVLRVFLDAHAAAMGRTALSYATEHLNPAERAAFRAR